MVFPIFLYVFVISCHLPTQSWFIDFTCSFKSLRIMSLKFCRYVVWQREIGFMHGIQFGIQPKLEMQIFRWQNHFPRGTICPRCFDQDRSRNQILRSNSKWSRWESETFECHLRQGVISWVEFSAIDVFISWHTEPWIAQVLTCRETMSKSASKLTRYCHISRLKRDTGNHFQCVLWKVSILSYFFRLPSFSFILFLFRDKTKQDIWGNLLCSN